MKCLLQDEGKQNDSRVDREQSRMHRTDAVYE